ncbi:MAG TPA: isoaspartyl peptidase/L-asparaginase, partial [Polyangiales bacterium]
QHPVRLAFAAASSPHRLLVGEGAQRVAEWLDLPEYSARTPRQLQTYEGLVARFAPGHQERADATAWGAGAPGPGASAWQAYLEPPRSKAPPTPVDAGADAAPPASDAPPAETSAAAVALLVRAGPGAFAGAIETGGAWLALPGSVGAIATPGAALHVAARGAVALAGPTEHLIAAALARRTYDKLLAYQSARAAAAWALEQAEGRPLSILVMDARNIVTLSNAPTAWAKADPNESTSAPIAAEGPPR